MGPRHSETPCFVSPHPDIVAKLKADALKVQGGNQKFGAMKEMAALLSDSQRIPGMDDGLIFPKEHYDHPVSLMAMSQAAADRAPLRGDLRWVGLTSISMHILRVFDA